MERRHVLPGSAAFLAWVGYLSYLKIRSGKSKINKPFLSNLLQENGLDNKPKPYSNNMNNLGIVGCIEQRAKYHDGNAIVQVITVNKKATGHFGVVHGGFISMLFDDSLGSINTGKTILTAYVKANFKAPMRPLCTYYLVGKLDRIEGRKIFSTGTITDENGKVFATAEALQIIVNEVPKEESKEQKVTSTPAIESAPKIQEARPVSFEFTSAQESVKNLTIDPRLQMKINALAQQAMFGNCQDSAPSGPAARSEHSAWAALKGKTQSAAETEYIEQVKLLVTKKHTESPTRAPLFETPVKDSEPEVRTPTNKIVEVAETIELENADDVASETPSQTPIEEEEEEITPVIDDIPKYSPEEERDWNAIRDALLLNVNVQPWSKIIDESWLQGWLKANEETSGFCIRTAGTVRGLPYANLEPFFSDARERCRGDDTIKDCELLEEDKAANTAIFRYVIKSPSWVVSDRDAVLKRSIRERWPDADSTCVLYKSTEHSKYPAGANKCVRSVSKQGWVIKKTAEANKFEILMYMENNPGGSIPQWIVNKAAGKMPTGIYERLNKRAREFR